MEAAAGHWLLAGKIATSFFHQLLVTLNPTPLKNGTLLRQIDARNPSRGKQALF
jgi:hypothetical protein